tara:strand:+ start:3920 stop:4534 length:615 start_codon:yes stop_codon:yes gene_type:complete
MKEYYEDGTDEGREFAQKMTPGQEVESYINEAQKELKSNKKKHFSQVFQNPLKGFPYNEEFEVEEIKEDLDDIEGLIDEELMEASFPASLIKKAQDLAKKMGGNMTGATKKIEKMKKGLSDHPKVKHALRLANEETLEEDSFADKSKKSGISVGTLKKVYNRGVAAWKTGHRPGTTPQQWGHARVNAFIVKKKKGNLNHDKDLA